MNDEMSLSSANPAKTHTVLITLDESTYNTYKPYMSNA